MVEDGHAPGLSLFARQRTDVSRLDQDITRDCRRRSRDRSICLPPWLRTTETRPFPLSSDGWRHIGRPCLHALGARGACHAPRGGSAATPATAFPGIIHGVPLCRPGLAHHRFRLMQRETPSQGIAAASLSEPASLGPGPPCWHSLPRHCRFVSASRGRTSYICFQHCFWPPWRERCCIMAINDLVISKAKKSSRPQAEDSFSRRALFW